MVILFLVDVIYKHEIGYRMVKTDNKKEPKSIHCLIYDCKNCLTETLMELCCDVYSKGQ